MSATGRSNARIPQRAARKSLPVSTGRKRVRGLTLIELLVSLTIMAFVMTLVSQAVFQVGQIVRVADESVVHLAARWSRGWAASTLLANLAAPREGKLAPMTGSTTELAGYSTAPVDAPDAGVQPFGLRLRDDASGNGSELLYLPARPAAQPIVIAHWPVRVEFRYRAADGLRSDRWPTWTRSGRDTVLLPAAVELTESTDGALVMAFAVPAAGARQAEEGSNPFGSTDNP